MEVLLKHVVEKAIATFLLADELPRGSVFGLTEATLNPYRSFSALPSVFFFNLFFSPGFSAPTSARLPA